MKVLRCPKLAVNPYANIGDSSDAVYDSNYFERKFADIPIILGVPTSFRYLKIAKLKKSWKFVYILAKITLQFHDFLGKIISSKMFFKKFPSKTCWDIQ